MTQSAVSTLTLNVEGMGCGACAAKIEKALGALDAIQNVSIDLGSKQASIRYLAPLTPAAIIEAIQTAGYDAAISA